MAYRLDIPKPPDPENMLPKFEVRNGAILDIAFPCYYLDVIQAHDSHYHDYIGWPSPNYHGQACQFVDSLPFHEHAREWEHIDWVHPHPIDLTSFYEGYDSAYVTVDKELSGLTLTTRLDTEETNVVYLRAKAALAAFTGEPKECTFTVFLHAPARTYQGIQQQEKIDQVIRGKILVLPGNKQ